MLKLLKSPEICNGLTVALAGAFLCTALTLEYATSQYPCALCMTQRFCMMAAGVMSLGGLVHSPRLGIYPALSLLFVLIGVGYAIWHIILMLNPELSSSCGPSLQYLVENSFGFGTVLNALLKGTTSCAEFSWIPFAALSGFLVLTFTLAAQLMALFKHAD